MHDLMRKSKYAEIIDITKKMLSIDYSDMEAAQKSASDLQDSRGHAKQ